MLPPSRKQRKQPDSVAPPAATVPVGTTQAPPAPVAPPTAAEAFEAAMAGRNPGDDNVSEILLPVCDASDRGS